VHAVLATNAAVWIGRSLRESFFMVWETLWALILGFTLSGAVQALGSTAGLHERLGSRRPSSVARATGYGMVSSSCSYAASAMARSLVAKGADFITAMVFMVASTNLVVELGLVLLVLMGWQFLLAEFVGGPIMIVLLALGGGLLLGGPLLARVRTRVRGQQTVARTGVSDERQAELEATPLGAKLREPAALADASSFAVADFTMLRRELVVGYVIAGFLAVVVPSSAWHALFLRGHGFWTTLENALVGPLIAVVSCVCSIGNVPLAAALWSGGISFGGVIAFLFADLIALPLIFIYAKFYGWRLTLRLVATLYVVMVLAGLLTELLFGSVGLLPTHRSLSLSDDHLSWNYTTWLNIIFGLLGLGVWWLARHRERFGSGAGYSIDPVCGMQVRTAQAPAVAEHEGRRFSFCSERCRDRFEHDPERFTRAAAPGATVAAGSAHGGREHTALDPICSMTVETRDAPFMREHGGQRWYFCGPGCAERFDAEHREGDEHPSIAPEQR